MRFHLSKHVFTPILACLAGVAVAYFTLSIESIGNEVGGFIGFFGVIVVLLAIEIEEAIYWAHKVLTLRGLIYTLSYSVGFLVINPKALIPFWVFLSIFLIAAFIKRRDSG